MFYKLLRDICSQGHRDDGADEEPVPPHRSTNGDRPEVDLFSLALGQPFSAATASNLRWRARSVCVHARNHSVLNSATKPMG
jgi:hypothetical protein